MTESTEFHPQPSGKSSRFFLHLTNWSELLSWFSMGVAISFASQLMPTLTLLYPIAFTFALAYWGVTWSSNKLGNTLRLIAITASLVGFWNLAYLYRDGMSAAAIILVLLAIGGLYLWLKLRTGN